MGQRIKAVRRQRGLSQAQLAHPELSDSYVSLIESGKRTPTPAVLELLAAKLDCSLTYLINGVTAEQMEEIELGLRYAELALQNGEVVEARTRYAELLDGGGLAGLPQLRQDAEYGLALATEACGDLDEAIALLDRIRRSDPSEVSPERHISIAIALSRCHRERGDLTQAVEVAERILGGAVRPAWNEKLIELGTTLLAAHVGRGDLLRAQQIVPELLSAAESVGTPRAIVLAQWAAAIVAVEAGRGDEAVALMDKSLAIHSENADVRSLAVFRCDYASVRLIARPLDAKLCRDMLVRVEAEIQDSATTVLHKLRWALGLARAELLLGAPDRAEPQIRAVCGMLDGIPSELQTDARLVAGQTFAELGRSEEALRELAEAADLLESLPTTRYIAQSWLTTARILERVDEPDRSVEAYHKALDCVGL
ncbi:helix-turn-helix domain-containing protein [Planobispora siamensis]|uniref:helix-turn-helix domain-containing protein n=1 Tax=Planobispora siamensis TaxID=936338 RepID=UPI001EF1DE86|nr:helix-turn-helix transcriptional regulator [Planobispora siamensis]